MNIAILCVLIAGLQPMVWGNAAKMGSVKSGKKYNNAAPRPLMDTYSGWHQRALWAMQNSYEAFPLFAAAVAFAMIAGVNQAMLDQTAIAYIVLRFAFGLFYIFDKDMLRSFVWVLSLVAILRLFIAAI